MIRRFTAAFLLLTTFLFPQTWHKADQPEGGYITLIDSSPADTNKIILETNSYLENVLWYSENGGRSWNQIGNYIGFGNLPAKIDPLNNRIYLTIFGKILVTTNYGTTWDTIFNKSGYPRNLQINPEKPNELLFTHYSGFYRSSDFGKTWNIVYNKYYTPELINYSPVNSNFVAAKYGYGFLLSTDSGITWDSLAIPKSSYDYPVLFDPFKDSTLYTAYVDYDNYIYLIQESKDLGRTWNIINQNSSWLPNLCYKEDDKTVFISYGSLGIYKSIDSGNTWDLISPPASVREVKNNGTKLYAAFESRGFGIYERDDKWTLSNTGIKTWYAQSITFSDSLMYFLTGLNIFTKKKNQASEWEAKEPNVGLNNIIFYNSQIGFAYNYVYLYKTTDGGKSWLKFPGINWPAEVTDIKIIGDYIYAAVEDDYNSGIYKSPVSNPSWSRLSYGNNTVVMYDGTFIYNVDKSTGILNRVKINGTSFAQVCTLATGLDYTSFAVKENPPGFFIGGYSLNNPPITGKPGALYFIKPDGGKTTIIEGNAVYSVAAPAGRKEFYFMTYASGRLYKADSIGGEIYTVEDGLFKIPNGQGGTSLFYFNIPGYQDKLFTNRGGFMELDLDPIPTSVILSNKPVEYSLSQNYPNPFNPATTINYSVATPGPVSIVVYNLLGQKVKELVNENMPAGNYSVNFNAVSLTSGVYFYKIQAENFSQVKKMQVVK